MPDWIGMEDGGGGLGLLMGSDPLGDRGQQVSPPRPREGWSQDSVDDPADLCRLSFVQKHIIHGLLPAASIAPARQPRTPLRAAPTLSRDQGESGEQALENALKLSHQVLGLGAVNG